MKSTELIIKNITVYYFCAILTIFMFPSFLSSSVSPAVFESKLFVSKVPKWKVFQGLTQCSIFQINSFMQDDYNNEYNEFIYANLAILATR